MPVSGPAFKPKRSAGEGGANAVRKGVVWRVSVARAAFGFKNLGRRRAARDFGEPETGTSHHAEMNVNLHYVLSVLWFILWLAALVDCLKGNSPNKLVWVVVIILLPFLGSILYFAIGKSRV